MFSGLTLLTLFKESKNKWILMNFFFENLYEKWFFEDFLNIKNIRRALNEPISIIWNKLSSSKVKKSPKNQTFPTDLFQNFDNNRNMDGKQYTNQSKSKSSILKKVCYFYWIKNFCFRNNTSINQQCQLGTNFSVNAKR
jgi:hypothetical protein